jgi:hypothetical protein
MGGRREKELQFVDFQLSIQILSFINVCVAGRIGALGFGLPLSAGSSLRYDLVFG